MAFLFYGAVPYAEAATPTPSSESLQKPFMFELVRYLYRWHLDADDLKRPEKGDQFVFWVRDLEKALDEGDESRFAEVVIPHFGMLVTLKFSNYHIAELGVHIRNDGYKVVHVTRHIPPALIPAGYTLVSVDAKEMVDHLFRTRNDKTFPSEQMLLPMRDSVGRVVEEDFEKRGADIPNEGQILHLAPLSPVVNESWFFWETGRMLIRVASDIDLNHPLVWQQDSLFVDTYDLESQVVVSMDEAAGSNAYLTRDQIGRVLYNCIVLGVRLETPAPAGEAVPR